MIKSALIAKANEIFDAIPQLERQEIEKQLTLMTIDHHWKEHLMTMDVLRQGIHFRGMHRKTLFMNISASH